MQEEKRKEGNRLNKVKEGRPGIGKEWEEIKIVPVGAGWGN